MGEKQRLLLHSCCGPCSTAVLERLSAAYEITVYFYNPNITDEAEYRLRAAVQAQYLACLNGNESSADSISCIFENHNPAPFLEAIAGHEDDPEGGERCAKCFALRLEKTAQKAALLGIPFFSTTLSVSPHKNHERIVAVGEQAAQTTGTTFLNENFKKKAGYQRSVELSNQYGLYRQDYCGCHFSEQEQIRRQAERKR